MRTDNDPYYAPEAVNARILRDIAEELAALEKAQTVHMRWYYRGKAAALNGARTQAGLCDNTEWTRVSNMINAAHQAADIAEAGRTV